MNFMLRELHLNKTWEMGTQCRAIPGAKHIEAPSGVGLGWMGLG